ELPDQPDASQENPVAEPAENETVAFEPWSAEDENAGYAAVSDVLAERPAEMEMPSEEEISPEMGEADEPDEISDEMAISHEPDEISVEMAGEARRQTDEREKGFSAGAFDRVAKIGPGMQMRLHDAGIRSVEDLAFADIDELKVRLGAAARLANVDEWHRLARSVVGESDG
ncbi:MAG: helix-hairpin-helix domain-containing protein, partial [Pseudomonadota bacterium]